MAKQRPTWAKRMKELQQMERKQAKAAKRAEKKDERPSEGGPVVEKISRAGGHTTETPEASA